MFGTKQLVACIVSVRNVKMEALVIFSHVMVSFLAMTFQGAGKETMVNPGGSAQSAPVGAGTMSWKRCAGCGGKIADRFLLYAMDSYWHSRCLKCSCCQAQLGEIGTSCYTKSGMILCRNDYIRLFGNSGACSACGQSIPASELVMRAQGNVYHLKCFTCSTCRNRLVPGDRFHYINGSLFCEHDRPTALMNGHLSSLQTNPLLPDQKKEKEKGGRTVNKGSLREQKALKKESRKKLD
ncbi:LIM domain transcription factor LMO4 [Silurus meridionalis]|nr:LIM domain transcription factor LMO4 [Silurus meridionalis]